VTLTCAQCDVRYEPTASGRLNHKRIYDHAPSAGSKTDRKEGSS
jgi:hypothetical protein